MDNPEDIAAQIARLREQMEALMKDRVNPAMAEAAGIMNEHAEVVAGKVREQPLMAVLIAAGIGYLLGRVSR